MISSCRWSSAAWLCPARVPPGSGRAIDPRRGPRPEPGGPRPGGRTGARARGRRPGLSPPVPAWRARAAGSPRPTRRPCTPAHSRATGRHAASPGAPGADGGARRTRPPRSDLDGRRQAGAPVHAGDRKVQPGRESRNSREKLAARRAWDTRSGPRTGWPPQDVGAEAPEIGLLVAGGVFEPPTSGIIVEMFQLSLLPAIYSRLTWSDAVSQDHVRPPQ